MDTKKLLLVVSFFLLLSTDFFAQTVYVTRTGAKYHSAGCQYLRQSSIPMQLKDALASGYTACSRCNPPRQITEKQSAVTKPDTSTKQQLKTKGEMTSQQCQAITKKGTQCKRKAEPGSKYCWQHSR